MTKQAEALTEPQGQAGAKVVRLPTRERVAEKGRSLDRINQFDFYALAQKLHRLDTVTDGCGAPQAFWAFYGLQACLDALLQGDPIELGVSRKLAEAFRDQVAGVIQRHFTQEAEDGSSIWKFPQEGVSPLSSWEIDWSKKALDNFEMIFAEEMREAATYRVPTRGIYDIRKLVDDADCTFPNEILGFVSDKSKAEWRAAGRCLAFGMFTACGFHVARAVEGALEAYFECFNGGPDKKHKNWGHYLEALEKCTGANLPNPKTLGELRQLKDDWRNPLMHPRVILEEADARTVFNNGETLIIMMGQELRAAAAAKSLAPLLVSSGGAP